MLTVIHEHRPQRSFLMCGYVCAICGHLLSKDEDLYVLTGKEQP